MADIPLKRGYRETEKAVGVTIRHNDIDKIMWIPKSQIENPQWKLANFIIMPDWLYNKKVDELFFT